MVRVSLEHWPLSAQAIIPIIPAVVGFGADAHACAGLVCNRSAGGACRAFRFRARQARRARSNHLQQIKAHHSGRPRPLAVDQIDQQGAGGDRYTLETFVGLIQSGTTSAARGVPLFGFAEAGAGGYFDDGGFPAGGGWDEIAFPAVNDEHAYALEVSGESMEPAYRDGDIIVVSPAAPIRRGDRVVVKTRGGEVMERSSSAPRRNPSS